MNTQPIWEQMCRKTELDVEAYLWKQETEQLRVTGSALHHGSFKNCGGYLKPEFLQDYIFIGWFPANQTNSRMLSLIDIKIKGIQKKKTWNREINKREQTDAEMKTNDGSFDDWICTALWVWRRRAVRRRWWISGRQRRKEAMKRPPSQ